jgi:hypothetical protein
MKGMMKTAATRTTTASRLLLENQTKISYAGVAALLDPARAAARSGFSATPTAMPSRSPLRSQLAASGGPDWTASNSSTIALSAPAMA